MKKIILTGLVVISAFGHGDSKDPGMQLLLKNDRKGALEIFKKECNSGNAWACGNAGIMFYRGMGVKENPAEAKKYYNKGCELHDIASCANLGEIAYKEQNMPAAKGYFQKVCGMKKYAKNKKDLKDIVKVCKRVEMIK